MKYTLLGFIVLVLCLPPVFGESLYALELERNGSEIVVSSLSLVQTALPVKGGELIAKVTDFDGKVVTERNFSFTVVQEVAVDAVNPDTGLMESKKIVSEKESNTTLLLLPYSEKGKEIEILEPSTKKRYVVDVSQYATNKKRTAVPMNPEKRNMVPLLFTVFVLVIVAGILWYLFVKKTK